MTNNKKIEEIKNTMYECFSELKKMFNDEDISFTDMARIQDFMRLMNITDWEESLFS